MDVLDRPRVHHGSQFDTGRKSRPDLDGFHGGGELVGELVVDRLVGIEAIGRGAGLAAVAHLRDHRALDRRVDVGIVEYQERRVATQFHGAVDDAVGRRPQQGSPDLGGAGEGQLAHQRVMQNRVNHLARAARRHDVHDARRNARLGEDFRHEQRRQGRIRRRFEDHRAAGRDGRRDLARGHGGRIVPRRNEHADADRLMHHDDPVAAGGRRENLAVVANRFLGIPAKELGGVVGFPEGVGQRLAVLAHDVLGNGPAILAQQLPRPAQDLGTFPGYTPGPLAPRLMSDLDGPCHVLHGGAGDVGDGRFRRWILHREGPAVGGIAPFAADEQLRSHFGSRADVDGVCTH